VVEERLTSSRRFDSSILMNQLIEKRSNISTRGVLVFFIFAAISIGVLLSHPSGYGVVDLSFLLVLVLLLTMFWKLFVAGEYSVFCSVFATTLFVMYWLVPLLQTNE